MLAVIGIVIGSDLPDIDAKSAPISKLFQILVPGAVVLVSLGLLGVWPPLAFALGAIAFAVYTWRMPRHRGGIHAVRAGVLLGAILAALLYTILGDARLCLWAGLCLTFGHVVHLWKDRWVRL